MYSLFIIVNVEKELETMFEGNPSIKPAASSSSCIFPVQEMRKELDGNCTEADENEQVGLVPLFQIHASHFLWIKKKLE
jgi:hypothetical protein